MKKVLIVMLILLFLSDMTTAGFAKSEELTLKHLSSYSTGTTNPEGGIAEIVKFNSENSKMYVVNGFTKTIDIVKINPDGTTTFNAATDRIDASRMIDGFVFGDITSVDVSTSQKVIAIAVQEEDYSKNGAVVLLDYDGKKIAHYETGVQPDMVTFTPDSKYVLTANEGEPRSGYADGAVDPKGSVTVVDLSNGVAGASAETITFDSFDAKRDELVVSNVIVKKATNPSVDFEPEYIAVAADSKTAYVSLQEANAIAEFDITAKTFKSIKALGLKDHSLEKNVLDVLNDGKIELKTQDLYGLYMPDGLAVYEANGKTYVVTPNEGDSREWGDYENAGSVKIDDMKVTVLTNDEHDGLDATKTYLLGGRSFSIWDADTMKLVFDSGSDFEKITAEKLPQYFNASNDDVELDSRSGKKGPEPEDVKVSVINGQAYAFIGLERVSGIMVYNVTDPANAYFTDFISTRDFSGDIKGDVAPEGLCVVPAEKSPTGKPILLAAHEVSGTVAIYQIEASAPAEATANPKTGDNSLLPLLLLFAASAVGIVVLAVHKKRIN